MATENKKIVYIEFIRIIAIFFVIFNHTGQRGFTHFTVYEHGSFPYWFCMCFSIICGVSVPLFFMISGLLLMDKKESIKTVWLKRIPRYVAVILIFTTLHYLFSIGYDFSQFVVKDWFVGMYSSGAMIPYWFLYSYLAFLVGLPLLRRLVVNMENKDFIYLILVYMILSSVVSIGQYRLSGGTIYIHDSFNLSYLTNRVVFYPAIGYFFGRRLKTVNCKQLLVMFGLFIFSVALSAYMTNFRIELTGDLSEDVISMFYSSTRPLQVMFVFCLIRKLFDGKKLPNILETIVISIGGCAFGIYLIGDYIRSELYFIHDNMCLYMNDFLAILIYTLFVLLTGFVVIRILQLIPFVKKLL